MLPACLTVMVLAASGSSDYEDHLLPSQKIHTGVLKMRGLPFAATPDDIVYWFNSAGLPIQPLTAERSAIWAPLLTFAHFAQSAPQLSAEIFTV